MKKPDYDLCVIGGGINGAGIARDAAGRGVSVLLVEAQDLAGATSSASTKLIHGGLRYLEQYEFRLVREALREREVLLKLAPHIIRPVTFILPHEPGLRPAWMIRLGLFLYDHLAGRQKLQKSHGVNLAYEPQGSALQEKYRKGFSYADCWVDDARLVLLNAIDARRHGATVYTHTACTKLVPSDSAWEVTIKNMTTGRSATCTAAKIVNAAGPWVYDVLAASHLAGPDTPHVRLVKGSHIIVPRLFDGAHAFILQQPDRRIVFAIPYERDFTLIGTTDVDYEGDPAAAAISAAEIDYLCAAVNRSLKKPIRPEDIVHTYSGVRPLFDDGHSDAATVTRDYRLMIDKSHGPEILSVFGGKLTTYRVLAEHAVNDLCGGAAWTENAPLPGGDFADFTAFVRQQEKRYSWLPQELLSRYARAYGTLMDVFLEGATGIEDMGFHFGDGIYEAEIKYLVEQEWAGTAEDILWRRSKLGLHAAPETIQELKIRLPDIIKETMP